MSATSASHRQGLVGSRADARKVARVAARLPAVFQSSYWTDPATTRASPAGRRRTATKPRHHGGEPDERRSLGRSTPPDRGGDGRLPLREVPSICTRDKSVLETSSAGQSRRRNAAAEVTPLTTAAARRTRVVLGLKGDKPTAPEQTQGDGALTACSSCRRVRLPVLVAVRDQPSSSRRRCDGSLGRN